MTHSTKKLQCVILDRDGVINFDSPNYIKSPEEWHAIPGSLEAIADLNRAGFHVFVATNQSGLARKYYDLEMLSQIHEKLFKELAAVGGHIDEIFFCPHTPDVNCFCRKPKPGMLFELRDKYNVDLANTYFIGDSAVDVELALAAGSKLILVLTGNGKATLAKYVESHTFPVFENLSEAANFIIRNK